MIPPRWLAALREADLGVEEALLERLAEMATERVIAEGDLLVRRGEVVDSVYLVIDGKLEVAVEPGALPIQELVAGDIVGELALVVAGGKRSATVRATERSSVLCLSREQLDVLRDVPGLVAAYNRALEDRLRRAKIANYLRRLFGEVDLATLREAERRVKWVTLASGDELFRKGAAPDGAYIVAVGRLHVALDSALGEQVIDEVGQGEWVGEMALLNRNVRSATVYAARDSELAWLSNEDFDDLIIRYPRLLLETSKSLVARLERHMATAPKPRSRTRTFAVIPVGDLDIRWFVDHLSRCLAGHGSLLRLSAEIVDERLGKPGVASSPLEGAVHNQLSGWLMEQERSHDYVLFEANSRSQEWANRTIRQADHVLFIADGTSSPEITDVERKLTTPGASGRLPRASLILLQPGVRHSYPGTHAWISPRKLHDHHHVRTSRVSDVERVARILTGNAIGVVFGGGASRGYAHIGVVRALQEVGVSVDAVGGSSIGAVLALATAGELSAAEMLVVIPPLMRAAFFDPTLPVVSLMRGVNTLEVVRKAVGGPRDLEDFVVPLFVVSTNLNGGESIVHRTGPVELAIRASCSIPGIFPPVPIDGQLLVDGGLSNNVPADIMMTLFGEKVIAIDVMPDVELAVEGQLPASVSGWKVMLRALNPLAQNVGLPNILSTLVRSAMMSSRGMRRVDAETYPHLLYLQPAVTRWNLIDFRNAEPVADEGYRGTLERIAKWWAHEKPPPAR